ncbi:MAG: AIR synthase related protein [Pirellulaceae bacterium]
MTDSAYQAAGIDYDRLDHFKRQCQHAARETIPQLAAHAAAEVPGARGESAYLIETEHEIWAHVEEGLGTKNLVADAVLGSVGPSAYHSIGIDLVATIVNDMITSGALPLVVAMHAAVGDVRWFDNVERAEQLAAGFAEGCRRSGAVWGGGETPALPGVVSEPAIVLGGSAIGRITPKERLIRGDVEDGDVMVCLASSGIHTNGLSLCRKLAAQMPQGFETKMTDGRTFGAALCVPSIIYVDFVKHCQHAGITLRYAVHMTGHGWRKVMRLAKPLVYRMQTIPPSPVLFEFIMQHGAIDLREAYATFNMGVGFVVMVRPEQVDLCVEMAHRCGVEAWIGGRVEATSGEKSVVLEPLGIEYDEQTLNLRD